MDFLELVSHHTLDHTHWVGTILGVKIAVTKHVLMMWIAAGVLVVLFPILARRWPLAPGGFRGMLEAFVIYLRDEVILPNTGEAGRRYVPYFLSLFFFILLTNLIGLLPIPGFGTATGNIAVTCGLALCTLVLINVAGVREHGFAHHFGNFVPHGLPGWLIPMMLPLEILGMFTRAFALTIRLFANMFAGHVVILAFLSLIFIFGSLLVAVPSVLVAVVMTLMEIFVCFLQAYIFTLLSSLFVGTSLNPH
jgi:F-type H+-transporting ATPase subunit a